ncbi:acetyl-CoA C-acyltransferase [Pseudooceanicola sp. 200-1SW]|uniref:acetyl-CoA C-acyltransferase n=1 Tax=Pseudooceanicola sp. 200-1SW TaxID=3425949 RepID=UPI003D7F1DC5
MGHIYLLGPSRTAMGGFQGALSGQTAPALGTAAITAALTRSGLTPEAVDEVLMGNVLPAGLGQAPARQASVGAGLPLATPCTTISKVCGSGMKAVMLARDLIAADSAGIVVAGGMESMTNAPYLLDKARRGYRAGHGRVLDHMFLDGLEDAYDKGRSMGTFAEDCAEAYGFSREAQDAFAIESLARANRAIAEGAFAAEITALDGVETDEQPGRARPEKIPTLRPAFREGGTVTAATSSSISDGAAAMVLASEAAVAQHGLAPMARIVAQAGHAQEPGLFTTAPIPALRKVLEKAGWSVADVDLWEVNEAFAVVTMAAMQDLAIPHEQMNVNGGACALGHPIGCSGARILVTLAHALRARGLRRGVAALCIGGGEATAVAIELV